MKGRGEQKEGLTTGDPEYNLYMRLELARLKLHRAREKELQKYGLKPIQPIILYIINSAGKEMTPAEISRQLLREPQTVTSVLQTMHRKGLIKKTQDSNRKNIVRLSLTPQGALALEQAFRRGVIQEIAAAFTEEKRKELCKLLEDLYRTVEEWAKRRESR